MMTIFKTKQFKWLEKISAATGFFIPCKEADDAKTGICLNSAWEVHQENFRPIQSLGSFYFNIFQSEIHLLRKSFSFCKFISPSCESFSKWTRQFESINSFLADFNDLFSVQILLAMFDQVLALCFTGYIAAKYFATSLLLIMASVFLNGLAQNLIYCVLGQSIANEADELMSLLSSGTWSRQNMFPVCHVLLSTVKRNFTLCIGNFFTLNMEFFASVIGIVFTYFMILRQF
ncbi:Hypothetical predicted protein [Cloeon dipterum]|uniref:Uncharacterized protein n=1 Tax=Cloeon dipterum TaxID=197152 RepID=A0A8S1CT42_9INSE|nr:Hypothetical predicted protein [Cloeon dipterum]